MNGGCFSLEQLGYAPYQTIDGPVFCAVSGWYQSSGTLNKDVDWFILEIPRDGYLDITIETGMTLFAAETNPVDCDNIEQISSIHVPGGTQQTMTITGNPADLVFLLITPNGAEAPWYFEGGEFDYVIHSNIEPPVPVESRGWTNVKSFFR